MDLLTSRTHIKPLTEIEHSQFRSVLMGVGYIDTRADLAFVVSHLQGYQNAPLQQDLMDLWHLLRYLNRVPHLPLVFKPTDCELHAYVDATDCELHAYVDASFAIHADMRSHYGYMIFFGSNENSPILAKSGKLKAIHRSSTEAEISGVNELASELLWVIDLCIELGYSQEDVNIMQDNQSCITLLQRERERRIFHSHSRHIRV
jgi:hypothetical protein